MKLTTRQELADVAASRWARQYFGKYDRFPEKAVIGEQLDALPPNPDPDEVDRIIGNKSWTHGTCDECDRTIGDSIECGDSDLGRTFNLCLSCVRRMHKLARAAAE